MGHSIFKSIFLFHQFILGVQHMFGNPKFNAVSRIQTLSRFLVADMQRFSTMDPKTTDAVYALTRF
jgi:hypothetical protein